MVQINAQIIADSHRGMYALISQIDHQIGALIGELREKKLLNNTLIIFHSDHGDMLFDHNTVAKALPLEGSAHIPFIVVPPEQAVSEITFHQKCTEPVCIEDIMPTILDYCGVPIPKTVEGKSLRPQIERKKSKKRDYIHIVSVGNHALTNGKIKYCWFGADGTELLFNLDKDPRECKDLSTNPKHKPLLKEWRSKLIRELTRRKDPACKKGKLVPHPVKEAKNIRWLNQFGWNNRGWDH
jgi:arylsulfatase A-like enzyme